MKRTVFDDQLAHRLGGHKGRLHRNSSPRLCLHWQTTSPSLSLQRNETRVELSTRQYRILTLHFVSQSTSHCRTWWAVRYKWAKLSLAHSGSLWLTLAHPCSFDLLWRCLWLTLWLSLSLVLIPALTHFGFLRLTLALSGVHQLTRSLLGSLRRSSVAPVYQALIFKTWHLLEHSKKKFYCRRVKSYSKWKKTYFRWTFSR